MFTQLFDELTKQVATVTSRRQNGNPGPMTKGCMLALTLLLAGFMLAVVPAARGDREFSNADLRGAYGWTLEGTFAGTSLVALRQFTADGAGKLSGEGKINLGTGGLGPFHFDCSYLVMPDGTGTANCVVAVLGQEHFAFVLIDGGREVRFISVSDQAVIRGIARKQSSSQ